MSPSPLDDNLERVVGDLDARRVRHGAAVQPVEHACRYVVRQLGGLADARDEHEVSWVDAGRLDGLRQRLEDHEVAAARAPPRLVGN